jgi:dihydrofolate synthase/folylpolyglutamate synthase
MALSYPETLDYLYSQLPMFTRIGAAAIKKDLTNTLALCKALHQPQERFKSIHIAGTNGKGSTSHMLASVLQEAGFKVGLYTSPHLKDFRERIRINGQMISEQEVVDFVEKHKALFEEIKPSFFEWTIALCFQHFALHKVDIAIIETGLGGRLDSTNVISPILSVITNIGWDHMDMLGDSLDKIAFEKAGIIKTKIPVVIGEVLPETERVFKEKSKLERAEIRFAEKEYSMDYFSTTNNGVLCDVKKRNQLYLKNLDCDLGGIYQQKNIITLITAIDLLKEIDEYLSIHPVQSIFTENTLHEKVKILLDKVPYSIDPKIEAIYQGLKRYHARFDKGFHFLENGVLWYCLDMGIDKYMDMSIHERINFKGTYFF